MSTSGLPGAISRRAFIIESTQILLANAIFTGPWHDTTLDGTQYVAAIAISNVASAATTGFTIQESMDQISVSGVFTVGAQTTNVAAGLIRRRYWRVVYTNGATNQTSFSLIAVTSEMPISSQFINGLEQFSIFINQPAAIVADNVGVGNLVQIPASNAANPLLSVANWIASPTTTGGANFWVRPRTPSLYKSALGVSAAGATTVWTPALGNKFRLLKYKIHVTANASLAAAGLLTIKLTDSGTDMQMSIAPFVPAAAAATLAGFYESPWIDLGYIGYLSLAANNQLQVSLSAALTNGAVNVLACGNEE